MSDTTPSTPIDDDDSDRTVTLKRSEIRALEKKAKGFDEATTKLASYERDAVFRKAGIDPDDAKQKWFVKGYDGELEVDKIKAAATEAGFLEPPTMTDEQAAQAKGTEQVVGAAAGATPVNALSEEAMKAEMVAAQREGGTEAVLAVARKYGADISEQ